jgi:hypothetical protein
MGTTSPMAQMGAWAFHRTAPVLLSSGIHTRVGLDMVRVLKYGV